MPTIKIKTYVNADRSIVFDLSRSIDLHIITAEATHEKAIAGKTNGLIGLHEEVTWRALHLGCFQNFTSKITTFDRPHHFTDEMVKGIFKSFRHEHYFSESNGGTVMKDVLHYAAPLGFLGHWADALFLKDYLTRFIQHRNQMIKAYAESGEWKKILRT